MRPSASRSSQDQLVEGGGADRVEPGGRLVEEQQLRIERQRAGDAGALAHAAGQLGREFGAGVDGEARHRDLVGGDLVEQLLVDAGIEFLDRHLDVLGDGQRREQRAALEQHAPAAADMLGLLLVAADHRLAEHRDLALVGRLQADDRAHQHRLAGARAADHAEDLAAPDVEVEPVMDDLLAEAVPEAADLDDRRFVVRRHSQPISVKKTAKKASSTMTRKMPWTTAVVVR